MASATMSISMRLIPDDETVAVCLLMLNLWQTENPDKMILLMPNGSEYRYEIVKKDT